MISRKAKNSLHATSAPGATRMKSTKENLSTHSATSTKESSTVAASKNRTMLGSILQKASGNSLHPSASVNGKVIDRGPNNAIADTGTSLALVSDDLCKRIYEVIPGARFDEKNQGYVFPIGTPVKQLPRVTFAVGSKQFEVQKEDLGFAKVAGGMQYGGIQLRGNSKFDILGDTWLKSVYAIFDQGKKRFGVVQRIEGNQNTAVAPTDGKK